VAGRLLVLPDRVVATLRGLLERRFDGPTPVVPFTLLPRTGLGERQRFVVGTGSAGWFTAGVTDVIARSN